MLNRVILEGRLAADPEFRYTTSGIAYCDMRLAVERSFPNQQGEHDVDWPDIRAWRKLAETCSQYLKKGRHVIVEGRLETQQWQDQEGNHRKREVVVAEDVRFLDRPPDKTGGDPYGAAEAEDEPVPF